MNVSSPPPDPKPPPSTHWKRIKAWFGIWFKTYFTDAYDMGHGSECGCQECQTERRELKAV